MVGAPVRLLSFPTRRSSDLAVPLPLPLLLVVSQATVLDALQLQPAPAVTVTLLLPPLDVHDGLLAEIAYVQGAASCVTVKVCPAMVSVPVRELVVALAATA